MPPPPTGGGKLAIGMEEDPNFSKLSARDRELHLWGTTQVRSKAPSTDNPLDMLLDCVAQPTESSRTKVTRSGTSRSSMSARVPLHHCLPRSWSSGALNTKSFKPSCYPYLETASDSLLRTADISSSSTGLTWLLMGSVKSCSQSAPTLSSNIRRSFVNAKLETEPLLAVAIFFRTEGNSRKLVGYCCCKILVGEAMAPGLSVSRYRYNPEIAPFDRVLTQPYDKISPAQQEKYYAADPHNLIAGRRGGRPRRIRRRIMCTRGRPRR